MQRSWRTDKDKLTFIVCLPGRLLDGMTEVVAMKDDYPRVMVGDVNLFLFEDDATEDHEHPGSTTRNVIGEVEIMIAQSSSRGKGVGYLVLSMFLQYVLDRQEE